MTDDALMALAERCVNPELPWDDLKWLAHYYIQEHYARRSLSAKLEAQQQAAKAVVAQLHDLEVQLHAERAARLMTPLSAVSRGEVVAEDAQAAVDNLRVLRNLDHGKYSLIFDHVIAVIVAACPGVMNPPYLPSPEGQP